MENLKKLIKIEIHSWEEMMDLKEKIHHQLVGNQDYINSNIVLNGSDDRLDYSEFEVHVYIFNDCLEIPKLFI